MSKGTINKAIILGRVGQDPEMKATASGLSVINVNIATNSVSGQGDNRKEDTEWHRVTMFGKLAEITSQYVRKGSLVYVEGRIQTRKWQDQNGQDRYSTDIIANEMQMIGGKNDNQGGGQQDSWQNNSQDEWNAPAQQPAQAQWQQPQQAAAPTWQNAPAAQQQQPPAQQQPMQQPPMQQQMQQQPMQQPPVQQPMQQPMQQPPMQQQQQPPVQQPMQQQPPRQPMSPPGNGPSADENWSDDIPF